MFLFPLPDFYHFWESGYSRESQEIVAKRENRLCSYHYQRHHNYKKESIKGISNLKYLKPSKWGHPTVFEIDYWNLVQKPFFFSPRLDCKVGSNEKIGFWTKFQ